VSNNAQIVKQSETGDTGRWKNRQPIFFITLSGAIKE